jgi:hypothetical protein
MPLVELIVQEHIDWKEVAIYAAYGPLLSNFGHTWYRHLHVFTNRTLRMSTWQMISTKLVADALVFGPMHVTALLTWTHFWNARAAQVRYACIILSPSICRNVHSVDLLTARDLRGCCSGEGIFTHTGEHTLKNMQVCQLLPCHVD